jgi:hypothetical protein
VLSVLGRHDDKTVAEIDAITRFHDWRVFPEAVSTLADRGLVCRIRSSPALSGALLIGRHAENKDSSGPKLEFVTTTNFGFRPLGKVRGSHGGAAAALRALRRR